MPSKEELLEHANQNINAILSKMLADEEALETDVRNLEHYSDVFLMLMELSEEQKNWTSDVWKQEIHELYPPLMELRRNLLLVRERFWTSGEKARDYTRDRDVPEDLSPVLPEEADLKGTKAQRLKRQG